LFIRALKDGVPPTIHGDGEQTRDFTYVENAVQANITAFFAPHKAVNQVYNVACGERTSLNQLWEMLQQIAGKQLKPNYGPSRKGDVRDSLADISRARVDLGYAPEITLSTGLRTTFHSFN
jgi:UDP-N-acetylglucosamine 4-epimerase